MEEKDRVIKMGRPILAPLGWLQMLSFITTISSSFIWIWVGWGLAWRVGLTGILGMLTFKMFYVSTKVVCKQILEYEGKKRKEEKEFDEKIKEALNK